MKISTFSVLHLCFVLSFHLYGSDVLRCLQCANQIGSLVGTDKRVRYLVSKNNKKKTTLHTKRSSNLSCICQFTE